MTEHLVLNYTKQQNGTYLAKIVRQTYRGAAFNGRELSFKSSCGIRISSSEHPELRINLGPPCLIRLFVRGSDTLCDDDEIYIPNKMFLNRLQLAVREYNLTNQ